MRTKSSTNISFDIWFLRRKTVVQPNRNELSKCKTQERPEDIKLSRKSTNGREKRNLSSQSARPIWWKREHQQRKTQRHPVGSRKRAYIQNGCLIRPPTLDTDRHTSSLRSGPRLSNSEVSPREPVETVYRAPVLEMLPLPETSIDKPAAAGLPSCMPTRALAV